VNAPVEQTEQTAVQGREEQMDRIRIMPLALANKIAAGEVVQRPASAVKELIENALDAGAKCIDVVLQDAGSTLIQISDDGSGMTENDARMAVKRHATSKIQSVEDLESISTLGFRGEALASIASVSHFELRTGTDSEQAAIQLRFEGGEEVDSRPAPPFKGTSISVRNLYFNVPARRNFLKRPQTELKHILDAVQVLALAHPDVAFTLEHDGNMLLTAPAESGDVMDQTAARLAELLPVGKADELIRVSESTSYLSVVGFLGHPDIARRSRGLQFLFVNGRWVKHRYLEHAVHAAYEYLLPEGSYPFFALFLDIDPRHVDVNVHPTKSEVKFDDERGVYGMLRAVVGRALGTTLGNPDFSRAKPLGGLSLDLGASSAKDEHPGRQAPPQGRPPGGNPALDALLGGFASGGHTSQSPGKVADASRSLYEGIKRTETVPAGSAAPAAGKAASGLGEEGLLWQLHDTYILTQILSGLVIIDQQMAHERILYEQAKACLKDGFGLSQQLLFPRTIEFSASEFALLEDLMPDMAKLGFDIEAFGGNSVIVRGVPADIATGDERSVLDEIVDQYRAFERVEGLEGRENLARSMARRGAVRAGIKLSPREMRSLIDQLFQCDSPYVSPDGRPTMIRMSGNELRERFDPK
jgi:DNA mismatch repair protein MutL